MGVDNLSEIVQKDLEKQIDTHFDKTDKMYNSDDSESIPDDYNHQQENMTDDPSVTLTEQINDDDADDEEGRPVPIVRVVDGNLELDKQALKKILLRDDVKDRLVVAVSIVGIFRTGKSFLLNFFLRYLRWKRSCQDSFVLVDGEDNDDADSIVNLDSWIGEYDECLSGFSWRGGSEGNTSGILMWSKPFKLTLEDGSSIAVILMDTQGTYDRKTEEHQSALIFSLSTLCSSIEIYNISQNIAEHHLQHLQYFTEYGKLALEDSINKPFQRLTFLVRDWQWPYEFPYGSEGGRMCIEKKLEVISTEIENAQNVRRHIKDCFSDISCFLMPHPGSNIYELDFDGSLSKLEAKFQSCIKEFVPSILHLDQMCIKKMNGENLKCKDLFEYWKHYFNIFSSDKLPSAKNIYQSTAEANHLIALTEAKESYVQNMTHHYKDENTYEVDEFKSIHEKYLSEAILFFKSKKKIGDGKMNTEYEGKLKTEIGGMRDRFQHLFRSKNKNSDAMLAVSKARNLYNERMSKLCGSSSSLPERELKSLHAEYRDLALNLYHEINKTESNDVRLNYEFSLQQDIKHDFQTYQKVFELKNQTVLKQQSLSLIKEARELYNEHMVKKCSANIETIEEDDILSEHHKWLKSALSYFDNKHHISDPEVLKAYLEQLNQDIGKDWRNYQDTFKQKKQLYGEGLCGETVIEAKNLYHQGIYRFCDENKEFCEEGVVMHEHQKYFEESSDYFSEKTIKVEKAISKTYEEKLFKAIQTEFEEVFAIIKTRNEVITLTNNTKIIGTAKARYNHSMSDFCKNLSANVALRGLDNVTMKELDNQHKDFYKSALYLLYHQCIFKDETFKKSWEKTLEQVIEKDYQNFKQIFFEKMQVIVASKYMAAVRDARENYYSNMRSLIQKGNVTTFEEFQTMHEELVNKSIACFKKDSVPGYDALTSVHCKNLFECLGNDYDNFKDIFDKKQIADFEMKTIDLVSKVRNAYDKFMSDTCCSDEKIISEVVLESKHNERLKIAMVEYQTTSDSNYQIMKEKYRSKLEKDIARDYNEFRSILVQNNATNIVANNFLTISKARRLYCEKMISSFSGNIYSIDISLIEKYHKDCLQKAVEYLGKQENRGDLQTRSMHDENFQKKIEEEFAKMKNNMTSESDLLVKSCYFIVEIEARDSYYEDMMKYFAVDQDPVCEDSFEGIHNQCLNRAREIFNKFNKPGYDSIKMEYEDKLNMDIEEMCEKFKLFNSSSTLKGVPEKPELESFCTVS